MTDSAIVFFASPHPAGNTASLLNAFLDEMKFENLSRFNLYDFTIYPSDDCGYCKRVEGCSKSDIDELYSCLEKAHVLIFAFPVYNMSVPSPLKAILDRMQRYYNARFILNKKPPIKIHKKVVILSTCGQDQENIREIVLAPFMSIFTIINASLYSAVFIDNTDKDVPVEKYINVAQKAAQDLICNFDVLKGE